MKCCVSVEKNAAVSSFSFISHNGTFPTSMFFHFSYSSFNMYVSYDYLFKTQIIVLVYYSYLEIDQ